jgi:hypothetical protein
MHKKKNAMIYKNNIVLGLCLIFCMQASKAYARDYKTLNGARGIRLQIPRNSEQEHYVILISDESPPIITSAQNNNVFPPVVSERETFVSVCDRTRLFCITGCCVLSMVSTLVILAAKNII